MQENEKALEALKINQVLKGKYLQEDKQSSAQEKKANQIVYEWQSLDVGLCSFLQLFNLHICALLDNFLECL